MDLRKLKTLIDLVSESNISELEITEPEGKVRIIKADPKPTLIQPALGPLAGSTGPLVESQLPTTNPKVEPIAAPIETGHPIKSPMVGTFYRATNPGAKPFVSLGSTVKVGDPVCIIEAMKIMNEIEADISGTVTRVLCEDGQAVEYGQTLFIIE